MRIITWNLNHRTIEKSIPDDVILFFSDFKPDVIILNEFVDGKSRVGFKQKLIELGYINQLISPKIGIHNQIFIASKHSLSLGDICPPNLTEAAETNFLHVKVLEKNIELVGFRAPSYKTASERSTYWKQISAIVSNSSNRKIIYLGDINYDPFSGISAPSKEIKFDLDGAFKIPNPDGEWSFISIDGKNKTRIDHAIIADSITVNAASYITNYNNIILAGSKNDSAITDHAVLFLEINS